MRTTLDLPDQTFRQLKAQAALKGLKLKEFVTQLIERGLAGTADPLVPQPPNHDWEPLEKALAAFEPGWVLTREQPDPPIRDEIAPCGLRLENWTLTPS